MEKEKLFKKDLIGITKEEFDFFRTTGQINVRPARLIPVLKTGDEQALTSIFLTAVKLVKEYREALFKDIGLSKKGKAHFYTEANFKELGDSKIDGLIIVVSGKKIIDAAFFEMKNKSNPLKVDQIECYLKIASTIGVNKMITVSNDFVSDPSHSPLTVEKKLLKKVKLLHFSWTYLITKGQLLLFKNDTNIEDEDQVEIMREVLHYLNNKDAGVRGYTSMRDGWKELSTKITDHITLKKTEPFIKEAVLSWHEEEKDMALLMSRKLGVLVSSTNRGIGSIDKDIDNVISQNRLSGIFSIKNTASDIKTTIDFERRCVSMSIKVVPNLNSKTVGRISWIAKELGKCKSKNEELFNSLQNKLFIEVDVKHARSNLKVRLIEIHRLEEHAKGKEIKHFNIVLTIDFLKKFSGQETFIKLIEKMILNYYEGVVQHMKSWSPPPPKVKKQELN